MHTYYKMVNTKLVLVSLIAFAMIAMATTTILTQEAYAKHKQPKILNLVNARYGAFCGMNWQGKFHFSLGNASLSIPPGYLPYTPYAMCVPDYTMTLGPST
jgi:hypothetical protein